METTHTDVKPAEETSPSADVTRESQPLDQPEEKQSSIQDVVSDVLKKHGIADESSKEAEAESSVQKPNETDEKEPSVKVQVDKNEDKKVEEKVEPEQPKPLTDAEIEKLPERAQSRIRELVAEKNAIESQFKEPATRMKNVEEYCQKSNINAQDFSNGLQLISLCKTNPSEGIKQLENLLTVMKQQSGQLLRPDLQKKVDEGLLDAETAKEMNRLYLVEQGRKSDAEVAKRQQQQSTQQQLTTAAQSWQQQKMTVDPDFKPKSKGDAPDGKYELVMLKFNNMFFNGPPVYNISEAMALLDKAYSEVDSTVKSFLPPPKPRKPPVRSNSSPSEKSELKIDITKPGWAKAVVKERLARRQE